MAHPQPLSIHELVFGAYMWFKSINRRAWSRFKRRNASPFFGFVL